MIIKLHGGTAENVEAAKYKLTTLADSWGHKLTEASTSTPESCGPARHHDKIIDAVSLTALAVSLPSAALAVVDLADRIRKRRRAQELIDHARQLAAQNTAVFLMVQQCPVEITALDPDQLLDLLAGEDRST